MNDLMPWLQDIGTIFIVVLVLWFLGQDFLAWSGLDRPVRAVVRGCVQIGRWGVWLLSMTLGWIGYHLILGRDIPPSVNRLPLSVRDTQGDADIAYVALTDAVPPSAWSDQETDRQTAFTTTSVVGSPVRTAAHSPEKLLTLYTLLRSPGEVKREEARPVLNALGIPLNNNLWRDALPPSAPISDDSQLTPIAQRPTKAQFSE